MSTGKITIEDALNMLAIKSGGMYVSLDCIHTLFEGAISTEWNAFRADIPAIFKGETMETALAAALKGAL